MKKYFDTKFKPNWKKGDIIICIQNAGRSSELSIGKEYRVIDSYNRYNADEVVVVSIDNNRYLIEAFSSRFTTLKRQRKEKIKNINNGKSN